MGFDGAEIKRRKISQEKKADTKTLPPAEVKSSDPEQNTTGTEKEAPSSTFNIVGKIAGSCLFIIVVLGFIINSIEDHSYSKPRSTINTQPSSYTSSSSSSKSENFADIAIVLLNTTYGNVCTAEIEGWFTKTLKVDWTSRTTRFHAMKILAEVGTIKENLYSDGVRYFKFPNDAGTYNIIDWQTGDKKSNSERASYYFSK